MSEQKKPLESQRLFTEALELAGRSIAKEDPANRALAITGNNLACALEERNSRSPEETELMLLAARSARKFWEVAGGWMQLERAEYRLSHSYSKAGDFDSALRHAQACLEICRENHAPAIECFYGYEALAKVARARGDSKAFERARENVKIEFEKLSEDDKNWCRSAFEALN